MLRKYFYFFTAVLIASAASTVCRVFDTNLVNSTIDWISFAASGFLILEASYKLKKFKHAPPLVHASRFIRILIGIWVIIIHMIQFIWGIDAPLFHPYIVRLTIDWSALFFGIFLMCDGVWSIHAHYNNGELKDQLLRLARTLVGTCVLTIHILQFIRDY